MERYICIHGHFYQPPRENPWLEAVELQDSAAPYHDWNERITSECYAPNAVARILDGQGRILKMINNYSRMSFNFGPTLLSWLEDKAPETYAAILAADRDSQKYFSGHGSALAQAYNHIIMPLANSRDRRTQILWGRRDFEKRFGRAPEGMWLPETAVDLETLDLLAEYGLRFTILAPHQAARTRRIGERQWHEIKNQAIDTSRAYRISLPSGKSLALFFYHGPIARAVAFEGLLSHGERFIERLTGAFVKESARPKLVHIATDGESYGHHHRFGDMALAYVLDQLGNDGAARLTNYGEFFAQHPPADEVEIVEKSSWSCAHGIDRWWSDCGCNSGGHPDWNQAWRTPLRDALDGLRDAIAPLWEAKAGALFKDPWTARDGYIDVVNDRSTASLQSFIERHAASSWTETDTATALKLMEMQRHAMLMYTSCGWFFDDISGIEAVQVLQFAGRAVQLAEEVLGASIENQFIRRLAAAKSNIPEQGNGADIYARSVRPAKVDWEKLAAHYAVSALFENYPRETAIYCYDADREDQQVFTAGRAQLAFGRVRFASTITRESARLHFGVLHLGDHNITGGVGHFPDESSYRAAIESAAEPFRRADLAAALRVMERHFGDSNYSLRSLFRDQQRSVLAKILGANLAEAAALYRQIYEPRAPLMRFLTDLKIPLSKGFAAAAEVVLNQDLRAALEQDPIDRAQVSRLLDCAKAESIVLDATTLEFAYRQSLERAAGALALQSSLEALDQLREAASFLPDLPFSANLWKAQNVFYQLLQRQYPRQREAEKRGDETARRWVACFEDLGRMLGFDLAPACIDAGRVA
jgi:alpha-amylase/alpha-mannosidase (GH57 family)